MNLNCDIVIYMNYYYNYVSMIFFSGDTCIKLSVKTQYLTKIMTVYEQTRTTRNIDEYGTGILYAWKPKH